MARPTSLAAFEAPLPDWSRGISRPQRDGQAERGVVQAIGRTVAADGQALLVPELETNSLWAT